MLDQCQYARVTNKVPILPSNVDEIRFCPTAAGPPGTACIGLRRSHRFDVGNRLQ